jgi:cell division protein ZapB
MPVNNIDSLQQRIMKLLTVHDELMHENRRMRAAEASWQAERIKLMKQNEEARHKVNDMIQRLQTLERNCGQ